MTPTRHRPTKRPRRHASGHRHAGTGPGGRPSPGGVLVMALAGFLLLLVGLSALESMTFWLPHPLPFHASRALPYAAGGFLLLLGAFHRIPESPRSRVGPLWTLAVLGLVLGAGLYLRLYPLGEPNPIWSEDCGLCLTDGRTSLDFPDFRPLIYPGGALQPFIPYLVVSAYALLPTASSLLIQKLVWGLVDALAVWVHYLLGKEVGGRRAGLILAAAVALSKPMIVNCVSAQTPVSTPLALGVSLLFTFRFLRKTDPAHALAWGAAVAFGAYCYSAVRPYLWWVPVAVTVWLFLRSRGERTGRSLPAGLGIVAVWTYAFFRVNRYLPAALSSPPFLRFAMLLTAAVLLLWGLRLLSSGKAPAFLREKGALILGLFTAALLMAPILLDPQWAAQAQVSSVFNVHNDYYPKGGLTPSFWWGQLRSMFESFFSPFADRTDMGLAHEAFWSIHTVPLVLSGLAWALVRREGWALFLLGCVAVGFAPHLLSFESHTGRLMGVVTPLLLLGALSWDALLRVFDARGRRTRMAGVLALALWGAWSYQGLYHRFIVVLHQNPNYVVEVFESLRKNLPSRRVYLLPGENMPASWIFNPLLDDRWNLYHCDPRGNDVPRTPDGSVPDVVVYVANDEAAMLRRLAREYPMGRLEGERGRRPYDPKDPPVLYKFYIDGERIPEGGRSLFRTVPVPEGAWNRKYYMFSFGLGHGVIEYEDWVKDPLAPTPRARGSQTIVIRGDLRVGKAGRYVFTVEGGNYAVLDVGGRRVLDYRPMPGKLGPNRGKLSLKAGTYPVVLRTYLRAETAPPPVKVLFPGGTEPRPLGSY